MCWMWEHSSRSIRIRLIGIYRNENLKLFYDAIATICVHNLGMTADSFNSYSNNDRLADKVLKDIFSTNVDLSGSRMIKYGIQKTT